MNHSNSKNIARERLDHLVSTLSRHRNLIIVPTVICTVLAIGYCLLKSNTWTARQSLVIRDDLTGESFKPGRFESLESLKLAQETILEIARDPQVIRNALQKLGPPPFMISGKNSWPGEKVIEQMQGQITIAAPNGAEFGKTEVILLNTKGSTRERAREFIELMLNEVDQKLSEVRTLKVNSMIIELEQAVESAQISFDRSAIELQEMDAKFGADLSILRGLNLQQTGDGSLQQTIVEIRKEQRTATEDLDSAIQQRQLLANALEEPQQYLVTSSELLKMQPRLNQLVEGLSKAELELAALSGKFTDQHMEVISAKVGIRDIKLRILKEIQASIHGLSSQIESAQSRLDNLKHYEKEFENRLSGLSSSRVAYEKLEQEVGKKSEVLGQARQELAQIQSLGASTANLLTRVGEPQVATQPDGPGKRVIVVAGAMCGLLIGFGLLMFVAPPFENDGLQSAPSPHSKDKLISDNSTGQRFAHAELSGKIRDSVETTAASSPETNQNSIPTAAVPLANSAVDSARDNVQSIMASIKNSIEAQRKPDASKPPTTAGEPGETTIISLDAPAGTEMESEDQVSLKDAVFASPQIDEGVPVLERSELPNKPGSKPMPKFEVLELDDESTSTSDKNNADNENADKLFSSKSVKLGFDDGFNEAGELNADSESTTGLKDANQGAAFTDLKLTNPTSARTIDLSEMGSTRKDNLRPIDLTRSSETDNPEHPPVARIPEVTIQVPDIKPVSKTEAGKSTPPSTGESDDELSVEEIVQRIRAQQIAIAKESTSDIPKTLDQSVSHQSSSISRPNPFLKKDSSNQKSAASDEEPVKQTENDDQTKAKPIPEQIRRLSDSLSKFCAPVTKNDPELPDSTSTADF